MPRPPRKRKLTSLLIQRQRPAARAYLDWDTKQHGLALRVQPSGSRSYYCIYSFRGRPRWLFLGNAKAIALTDARRLTAEAMLQVAKGQDPAAERKAVRAQGTFEMLAARYVSERAQKHNKSWRQADYLVKRWLLPKWGKLNPVTITRADVRALLGQITITAPIVANQVHAAASAIFKWAVKQDILTANPCRDIERNPTAARERVLSDSELPKFWRAFDDCGLLNSAALKLVLLTGQRPGEISHMRWEHIVDGWWEMPGQPVPALGWPGTKNKQTHRVWLPKPVWAILSDFTDDERRQRPSGYVLAGPRGAPPTNLDAAMRALCAAAKVPRATPHDLRRTFSTRVTALGFGKEAMLRVTNHKEGGIASVYDHHTYADENKRIMEAVAAHIMALAAV